MPAAVSAWVLTDGKAGDEQQCLGVAEALGLAPELRRVKPRAPFTWLMPWGAIDPREAPSQPESPIAPPFPDLAIASGRRAVPYLRAVKRASGGGTFTVFLKDPRSGPRAADLIWCPSYDRLRGDNVVTTLTSPHRISPGRLAGARARPDPRLAGLPAPRVAVLVGGDSPHYRWLPEDVARFAAGLAALAADGAALMGTLSRRTRQSDPMLQRAVEQVFDAHRGFLWDGTGDNPYLHLLALADAIVVSADSVNMLSEAAATGRAVLVFRPSWRRGRRPRYHDLIEGLEREGAVKPFSGRLERSSYHPIDSTPLIAEAIASALARHRLARGLPQPA